MSIISEALKKAERDRALKVKPAALEEPPAVRETLRPAPEVRLEESILVNQRAQGSSLGRAGRGAPLPRPARFWPRRFRELLFLFGFALFCVFLLFSLPRWWSWVDQRFSVSPFQAAKNSGDTILNAQRKSVQLNIVSPDFAKVEEPSAGSAPRPAQLPFALTGVLEMDGDRRAVVNGSIVAKGDFVDGAFVKDILDREVVLDTRSGEIKLRIPS